MNPQQFFLLVASMREAQRDYFKSRSRTSLEISKQKERLVDAEIDRVKKMRPEIFPKPPQAGNLFDSNTNDYK